LIDACFAAHIQFFLTKAGDFSFHLVHLIPELSVFLNEALQMVCELNGGRIRTLTKSYWKTRVRFQSSKRELGSYNEPLSEAELRPAESQDIVRVRVCACGLLARRSKESGSKRVGGQQLRWFGWRSRDGRWVEASESPDDLQKASNASYVYYTYNYKMLFATETSLSINVRTGTRS